MSVPNDVVLFHCAKPILDEDGNMITKTNGGVLKETPTHTLAFSRYDDNTIIMGWAASRVEYDGYNKKDGREIAMERIKHLETRLTDHPKRKIFDVNRLTPKHLPNRVITSNFDFYIDNAIKALLGVNRKDEFKVVFRSYLDEEPVCAMNVDMESEVKPWN